MNLLQASVAHLDALLSRFDECRLTSYDGHRLVVIGDFDLSYHHSFEAEFQAVSYVRCPVDFHAQTFRLATAAEIKHLNVADYLDEGHRVFCFQDYEQLFLIAAQGLTVREGIVLHYEPGS